MIRGLVFDMDGLIFDSERIVQRSWEISGAELGIPNMGSHIYNTIGFNKVRREQYFRENIDPDFPMEEFSQKTRETFYKIIGEEGLAMKPGVKEVLEYAVSAGIKIALATSSRREYAMNLLTDAGIYDYFDGMVCGDMVTHAKPDPEIYEKACALIGVDPKDAVALEDAPSGIRSATAAGMRVIMVPDLVQPDEEIKKLYWYCFENLNEALLILKNEIE